LRAFIGFPWNPRNFPTPFLRGVFAQRTSYFFSHQPGGKTANNSLAPPSRGVGSTPLSVVLSPPPRRGISRPSPSGALWGGRGGGPGGRPPPSPHLQRGLGPRRCPNFLFPPPGPPMLDRQYHFPKVRPFFIFKENYQRGSQACELHLLELLGHQPSHLPWASFSRRDLQSPLLHWSFNAVSCVSRLRAAVVTDSRTQTPPELTAHRNSGVLVSGFLRGNGSPRKKILPITFHGPPKGTQINFPNDLQL